MTRKNFNIQKGTSQINMKSPQFIHFMAEREGFEPSVPFCEGTRDFQSRAFDRSAISPCISLQKIYYFIFMAERVGFEPTKRSPVYSISSRAPSASSATSPGLPLFFKEILQHFPALVFQNARDYLRCKTQSAVLNYIIY